MSQPRIHVVDGTFELYRAEFSKRPRKVANVNGRDLDVTATVGLVSSLLMLLSDASERVTHLAYAFDNPIRSFRNDLFADYKDDRGVPEGLRLQFDLVEEVVASLGVRVWRMVEYEADDALGTAARLFPANEVRILSPDKDLAQCLEGTRVVTVDRIRKRVVTHADFVAEKGYSPSLVPDFLALTGDPQDGIPGLPGFGEKTVSQLLAAFPGLDAIPDDASKWPSGVRGKEKLAGVLAERREEAQLYKKLATLVTDVPLGVGLDDLRVPVSLPDAFVEQVTALGSKSLLERAAKVIREGRVS
jgi:5'-3' exonuclease